MGTYDYYPLRMSKLGKRSGYRDSNNNNINTERLLAESLIVGQDKSRHPAGP